MKTVPPNYTILSASPDDERSIEIAKEHVREMRLTSDDVKIVKRDGVVHVITKREVAL